jgi:hypothetical protein
VEAAALERAVPGLAVLASAYSAARADSGICRIDGIFRRPTDSCAAYESRMSVPGGRP